MSKKIKILMIFIIFVFFELVSSLNISNSASTYTQYVKSGISAFPTSYQEKLKKLASKYPNWKFEAYYTGISWSELIENERNEDNHRNRVSSNSPLSWKHCDFVDDGWACASDEIVEYYLDPRNFLNETQIFQFVETSYNAEVQTLSAIQESVKGTFLDNTITCKDLNNNTVTMSYAEIILEAAKKTNISAFTIKSKIIQEVGSSGSGSVSGTYSGYEGYYNFFNYGAYDDGDDIANGLEYAKTQGWDSQYKAIVGGAELIGKQYIEQGQNTAYFTKWDVVGTKILNDGESQTVKSSDMFWHQYMTNIQDPTSQSSSMRKLYESSLQSEITFIIPVYNDMPDSNPMPQDVSVTGISLNKSMFIVNIDETDDITATITPTNATNQNIVWTVSDSSIVRVWNGHFRGLKEGTATVTATTVDGSYSASCTVVVRDKSKNYVSNITFEQSTYTVGVDDAVDIEYSYTPKNSCNAEFSWTSSNSKVLRVYYNRFRALKEGTAYVIVKTLDGTVEKKIKVTVKKDCIGIEPESSEYTINQNESISINCTYKPSGTTANDFTWTSSDSSVLRVYWNKIRGLKKGTAYVIVKSLDGTVEKKIKVTVKKASVGIEPESSEYTINKNESISINCTYSPSGTTANDFSWTSSDSSVLRVYWNKIRGLKKGTAYVIVKSLDGTVEKKIKVTVKKASVGIEPESSEYTINKNESISINCTYSPSGATANDFSWTSSDSSVLRVYWNKIRGLKKGTAYVIVKSLDGSVEKKIKVTVNNTQIKIEPKSSEYTISKNEAININCTYTPSSLTANDFSWTSSDSSVLRVYWNRVRGLKKGTAYIIVKSLDGSVEKKIKVTVE